MHNRLIRAQAPAIVSAQLLHAGVHRYDSSWRWSTAEAPAARWRGLLMGMAVSGQGEIRHAEGCVPLAHGVVYLLAIERAGPCEFRTVGSAPLTVAWMHFRSMGLRQHPPVTWRYVPHPLLWEQLATRAIGALSARRRAAACAFLRALLAEWLTEAPPVTAPADESHVTRLGELRREIASHPDRKWALDDMARQVGISRAHFVRLFRAHAGISPRQHVIASRLAWAKTYLQTTLWPIQHIAGLLGYCDAYALSRQFKARFGLSPQAFRTRAPDDRNSVAGRSRQPPKAGNRVLAQPASAPEIPGR